MAPPEIPDTGYLSITDLLNLIRQGVQIRVLSVGSPVGRDSIFLFRNVYSMNNVTTAAYVEITPGLEDDINEIDLFDSSGRTLVLAFGAPGEEEDQFWIVPGGNGTVPIVIPAGTRVSFKAVDATASAGVALMTFYK